MDTLRRLRISLGTDFVVVGSYLALPGGGEVRLDLRLQDAAAGETVIAVSDAGAQKEMLALVAGARLRQRLGAGEMAPGDAAAARASLPQNPEARTGKERWCGQDARLPTLITDLEALPDLSRVRVLRCRAEDVPPIPEAIVYLDGPYYGTTCAYGHAFPRPAQLAVAERWRDAGCIVAVSEQEPLPLLGWEHHELPRSSGFGRTWSRQQREFLTLSRPACGQQSLWGAA